MASAPSSLGGGASGDRGDPVVRAWGIVNPTVYERRWPVTVSSDLGLGVSRNTLDGDATRAYVGQKWKSTTALWRKTFAVTFEPQVVARDDGDPSPRRKPAAL